MTAGRWRIPSSLRSSASVAVAMAVMNIAVFAYTWLAARIIGPHEYGAYMAVMNLILIISVASLGLQATAARRISADPEHVAQIERGIIAVAVRASLAVGAVLALAAPLVDRVLELDDLPMALLVGVAAVPLTIFGAQAGILQGERRWGDLALLYLMLGVPRLVIGTALIWLRPDGLTAFLGVTAGLMVPVAFGAYVLRHGREPGSRSEQHRARPLLHESLRNSLALLAFFALSNVDMLIARNVLSEGSSGLYAAGLIVTRSVLFLPQFVIVVAFPSMSTSADRRRATITSLGLIGALGGLCVVGTYVLSDLALLFAGGAEYGEVEPRLWLFAALGTVMSMVQLLVYSVVARQGRNSSAIIWVGLAVLIGVGLTTTTLGGLLAVVLAVDCAVLVVLLAMTWWSGRSEVSEPPRASSGRSRRIPPAER